jgi:dienelactone hydrolase
MIRVYRPPGPGPYPAIVVLHGSSGLAPLELAWSAAAAAHGYIVVGGCYLDGRAGFIRCPGLPDGAHASAAAERSGYRTLVDAAAREPGVARDRIAVVGVSEGAIVALTETDPRVRAIVADSGYRRAAGTTGSPVLLLGFTNDPNVAHVRLVAFAAGERAAGAPVETHFYAGTGHVALLTPATTTDATARAFAFLGRVLR